ncbi:MAG: PAS domain S-box protein, partial [bacterium]
MADHIAGTTSTPDSTGEHASTRTSEHAISDAASFARAQVAGGTVSEGDGLYRLLVESVVDYAIFALDRNGMVLSWNPGAQRFKGYHADEIIGKHFSVFYTEDEKDTKPAMELELAAREGRVEDEGWRVRKDGSRFWANVLITALRDASGALVGFAKVTRDLSERRAAELHAIAAARRVSQAEEANQVKASFLAAMSHELRTPLNAIGGYADLLLTGIGGELSPLQQQYMARIRSSQQHLLAIINDILNFSRIEAGRLQLEIGPVSLQAVVDAVVPMIEPQTLAKNLRVHQASFDAAVVSGDPSKIEQILINLLSNAVKFTE